MGKLAVTVFLTVLPVHCTRHIDLPYPAAEMKLTGVTELNSTANVLMIGEQYFLRVATENESPTQRSFSNMSGMGAPHNIFLSIRSEVLQKVQIMFFYQVIGR